MILELVDRFINIYWFLIVLMWALYFHLLYVIYMWCRKKFYTIFLIVLFLFFCRIIFLKFFASILSGYRNFIVWHFNLVIRREKIYFNQSTWSKQLSVLPPLYQENTANNVFNTQAFLKKRSRSTNQPPDTMVSWSSTYANQKFMICYHTYWLSQYINLYIVFLFIVFRFW